MITSGSSKTSVYEDRDHVFGMLPRTEQYSSPFLEASKSSGAKSVAYVFEGAIPSATLFKEEFVAAFDLDLVERYELSDNPDEEDFDRAVQALSLVDPDVVVMSILSGCPTFVKSLRKLNWLPKAIWFNSCIQDESLLNEVGVRDMSYMTGFAAWSPDLPSVPDAVTSWPKQFAEIFQQSSLLQPTYLGAAVTSSVSVLVQAIEMANS